MYESASRFLGTLSIRDRHLRGDQTLASDAVLQV